MPLDYSKWDHIELSDDEDDVHPNIDTPSLFKWRHEARIQREEEMRQKKEKLQKDHSKNRTDIQSIEKKLAAVPDTNSEEYNRLTKQAAELKKQEKEFWEKEAALKKEESSTPLNVDSLSKEVQSKTVINKPKPPPVPLTEDEKVDLQVSFTKKNKKMVAEFGLYRKYEDSQAFIEQHPEMASEEAANALAIRCIDLQAEGKTELMKHVSHQTIILQFILELAKQLKVDPRSCVRTFFSRIKQGEKQYMDAFNAELDSFRERVVGRANVRLEMARKQIEEEEAAERKARLGPGGLDPMEVMESLPAVLQKCFESQDIGMLQQAVTELPKEEAEYHIKRCVDSGLWVPGAGDGAGAEEEEHEVEAVEEGAGVAAEETGGEEGQKQDKVQEEDEVYAEVEEK